MASTARSASSTALALLAMIAVEVLGLRSGTIGLILIGLVALLAVAVIVVRVDLKLAGIVTACAAAFTLSWNGWYVGPVRPGDVLVPIAIVLFVIVNADSALRTPPWWIKAVVLAIFLVVMAQIFFPPDPTYLADRIVITARGAPTVSTTKNLLLVNLGVGFKFIVAVAAIPLAFVGAVRADRRAVRWLPTAFATGTALSGWVATTDRFVGTHIGQLLTGLPNEGGRQFGFSDHPNFLAPALVLAFPFAYWLAFAPSRRDRWIGWLCFPGLLGGAYSTGSRGGTVAMVFVVFLAIGLHPRTRAYLGNVIAAAAAVGMVALVALPSALQTVLVITRLDTPYTTSGSDQVRAIIGAQGVRDFYHAPLAGIGLQVSDEASQVYLQELASGGLILFVGMTIYLGGGLLTSGRLMRESTIAGAVFAALIGTVALNFVEADLTDRFYYVPSALLCALLEHRRLAHEDAHPPPQLIPAPEPPIELAPALKAPIEKVIP